jgi:hypothetical protein
MFEAWMQGEGAMNRGGRVGRARTRRGKAWRLKATRPRPISRTRKIGYRSLNARSQQAAIEQFECSQSKPWRMPTFDVPGPREEPGIEEAA